MLEEEVLSAQRNEITEYLIYKKLALLVRNSHNRKALEDISGEELLHYHIFFFWGL